MITLPYVIANGQALDAIPVMANFTALSLGAAASGVNSDITQLTGLTTPLTPAQGGTGQNVATTPLTIAKGGTGGATAAAARTALGAAALGANSDITSLTGLTTALAVSEGGTGDTGTQWSTQAVTPTAGGGTLGSASAVWRFKVIGKTAFFSVSCGIATNGTGASSINIPLPTGWVAKSISAFGGQCTAASGKAFSARIAAATSTAVLLLYDATYPGASGESLTFNGVLELT